MSKLAANWWTFFQILPVRLWLPSDPQSASTSRHRVMLIYMSAGFPVFFGSLVVGLHFLLVMCLGLACLVIVVLIPIYASRGRFHIPGYVGLAFLTFAIGLLLGRTAGARAVTGTVAGLFLSIVFFLLIATALGSILALFFYSHPPEV